MEAPIRAGLRPSPDLLARVARARTELVDLATQISHRDGHPLDRAVVAGSAARGTFLADRLDIDLFLLFAPGLSREALEQHGMALGRALLAQPETRYAEHPYLRGTFAGFSVDAVPGFAVTDPSRPQSAVDRTPFHNEYLSQRQSPEMVDEVRLAKQFLRAQGIYGSEARTQGLSGYVVELLILKFGSLDGWLTEARHWRPGVRVTFTSGSTPRVPPEVPLVMDDPVDPHRNVSSALSVRNFATLVLAAQAYLESPDPRFFRARPAPRLSRAAALEKVALRGTHVAVLALPRPDLVDDIVVPQVTKTARAAAEEAERLGFRVVGAATAVGPSRVLLALETESAQAPSVRRQDGPPAGLDRVDAFVGKWSAPGAPVLQGPYVAEDGRLAIEARRPVRDLEPSMTAALERLSLGRDLARTRPPGASFTRLEETTETPELELALGELLEKKLPWLRE